MRKVVLFFFFFTSRSDSSSLFPFDWLTDWLTKSCKDPLLLLLLFLSLSYYIIRLFEQKMGTTKCILLHAASARKSTKNRIRLLLVAGAECESDFKSGQKITDHPAWTGWSSCELLWTYSFCLTPNSCSKMQKKMGAKKRWRQFIFPAY